MSPVSPPKEPSSGVHHDQPIRSAEEDLFGWGDLAEQLGDALTLPSEDPIVLGVYGAWGSGKSSLMNLVAEKLEERPAKESAALGKRAAAKSKLPTNQRCIIVRFNPWYFKGEEALIHAFFQEMSTAIDASTIPLRQQIVEAIKKYSALLVPLGTVAMVLTTMGLVVPVAAMAMAAVGTAAKSTHELASGIIEAMGTQESSLSEQRKVLMDALRKSKVRIVVLIDDIDRLYADDVLTMMKLVRLVGDLPCVSYLLGFDQEVVAGCLAKAGPQVDARESGKEYLAKIVQLSVQVPTPRADQLCEYAVWELAAVLRHHYPSEEAERLALRLHNDWSRIFGYRLHDLRQAKRVVNAIRVALPLIEGKIDPVDGVIFETLRVLSPEAHRLLSEQPSYLFEAEHAASIREGVGDGSPRGPLTEFLRSNSNVGGVLRDLLLTVAANSTLPPHRRAGRVVNVDDVRKALNLGVNPARVLDWKKESLSKRIQDQSGDTYNMLMAYYKDCGGWSGTLNRVRHEAAGLNREVARELLRISLEKASKIVQEIGSQPCRAELRLAETCALLMGQASFGSNPQRQEFPGALVGFLMRSSNLTVSRMIFEFLEDLSQRSPPPSAGGEQRPKEKSQFASVFSVYNETLRSAVQTSEELRTWLQEPPCKELRDALSLMGWNTSAMDESKKRLVLSRIWRFDPDDVHAGYRRILHIFFADARPESKGKHSRHTQLGEFIDPSLIAEALGPNPLPAPLTPEELTALANLPDDERALKLFFHAHLLANPTTAPL